MSCDTNNSSPTIRGGAELYICCQCGSGPQSIELCRQCYQCAHIGCSTCIGEYQTAHGEKGASSASILIEYSMASITPSLVNTLSQDYSRATHSPTSLPLSHGEVALNASVPERDAPTCVDENAWTHRDHVTAPATDGDYTWYCHQCGDGPYGPVNVACAMCYHRKCGDCNVYPAK